jgi:tRNA(fMet)-specific endonuclease VapC
MTIEYLLDTNVCIAIRDILAEKQPNTPERQRRLELIKARWSSVSGQRLAMSTVTLGELRFGAAKSGNPSRANARLDELLRRIQVLPMEADVSRHYADIRLALESSGQAIGSNDTWIAAHGRHAQRTVVTANMREFQRVPSLSVEDWTT